MKFCVIGGGLSGLVAASTLAPHAEVDCREAAGEPGGCLSSYHRSGYTLEKFYHHCFSGDGHLLRLIDSLGLSDRLEWLRGSTGIYAGGEIYHLTTPLEIFRSPLLSFPEKIRLALFVLRSKGIDAGELDHISAREFLVDEVGESIYSSFFEPLLRSKFGPLRDRVSAAWLVSRVAIRSDRGMRGERLGYLNGGFAQLVDRLVDKMERDGAVFHPDSPVRRLERDGAGWRVDGEYYDGVVAAIAPAELAGMGVTAVSGLPEQGAACLTIALEREVTEGIYWLNMKDGAPYGAVIGHTNLVPRERYGEDLVYLASYFTGTPPVGLEETMVADFCRRFNVSPREIRWRALAIEPHAGPVYTTGYRDNIPGREVGGIYIAGMWTRSNYPERSMEGSVRSGEEAAYALLRRCGIG
ncbi:MAG: NAD(P)/FAD-dependent oxidoreductase [Methanoculleaceae archaeon]